ncbi:hypothetical protein [Pseudomonas atacamensis]|uniref:hypothetical protein n=1 Tax=Pseudomonas atacamensis TaxID=2565368 RepID=UPI0019D1F863|nr:hypothetical protein [Pseudomonas atacamensis]QSL90433.1 hypothetical protein JWU58_26715 [Pseudomonas atacamensis]
MSTTKLTLSGLKVPAAIFLVSAFVAFGVGFTGKGDYEQAVADAAFYCQMVDEKAWPALPDDHPCPESAPHVATL